MLISTPRKWLNFTRPGPTAYAFFELNERSVYGLVLAYRWLSLIPPLIALWLNAKPTFLTYGCFALAITKLLSQTFLWQYNRTRRQTELKPPAYLNLMADLILSAFFIAVNGIWSSPYYLYALGPIFETAFFFGFGTALIAGSALSLSYLAALGLSLGLTGQGGNWLVSVTNITGFMLCSILFGYQSLISRQFKAQNKLIHSLAISTERDRLATDIHDVVVQSLFGLGYSLDGCAKLLPAQPELVEKKLAELSASTFSTLASLRAIVEDLWDDQELQSELPANTAKNNRSDPTLAELIRLIRLHLKNVSSFYSFKIDLETDTPPDSVMLEVPANTFKALYRATQEAFANAAKHATPSRVTIRVSYAQSEQTLRVSISDDGCGFDVTQYHNLKALPGQRQKMGLTIMQKRLADAGGSFQLRTSPGEGTTVSLGLKLG